MNVRLNEFEERSPILVLVLGIFTFGIYLIVWYFQIYGELKRATGETPTGNDYFLDLLLSFVTCGVWGIYVDYRISRQLEEIQKSIGQPTQDTGVAVLVLDLAAYVTLWITYIVSSAIQQDVINKLAKSAPALAAPDGVQPPPPATPPTRPDDQNPYS
jgi:uncharacterized membrane protein